MNKGFTDRDAKGRPLQPGRFAYFIDAEDGSAPQFTYGNSEREILDKLATTAGTAQATVNRMRAQAPPSNQPRPAALPPPPAKAPLSPDQVMVATADLKNPAKAGGAITDLLESHTGIDLTNFAREQYRRIAEAWQLRNPDFVHHPANVRLLTEHAIRAAGGLGKVTEQHLDAAYQRLSAERALILADELNSASNEPPTPPAGQDGNPEAEPRRPGVVSSTTYRRNNLSAPPSPGNMPPRLAYTREQIERMPLDEMERVIHTREYTDAFEYYRAHPA